jgi:3-oxoacyl-[acyl-carrier protein] reductase
LDLYLNGRVVFVTGGSLGIGKSIVVSLLAEGASIGTCARTTADLKVFRDSLPEEMRSRFYFQECDVRDSETVRATVIGTVEKFGRLDGVVTNAGYGTSGRVMDTSIDDFMSQYELKLKGVLNVVRAAVPALRESDAGRIVIINGITANVPDLEMAAVSSARAAVSQVAKMLAKDLAADQICVNTVNIGAIETDRQISRHKSSGSLQSYSDWVKQEVGRRSIALGRFGRVKEVSPAVMLLLSPLSSYITGSSIDITGGQNL